MIKAEELRIGNCVSNGEKYYTVDIGMLYDIAGGITNEIMEPIPLTPEVLLAAGFTTDENKVEYSIELPIGEGADLFIEDEGHPSMSCGIKSFPLNCNYFKDIKYLHDLQNLFFAITKTELQVKL